MKRITNIIYSIIFMVVFYVFMCVLGSLVTMPFGNIAHHWLSPIFAATGVFTIFAVWGFVACVFLFTALKNEEIIEDNTFTHDDEKHVL